MFRSSITQAGHTLSDRELYLPQDWTADPARRQQAGIPALIPFRTKPELAIQMRERLHRARVPLSWVVADAVYGGHLDLRLWLEAHQYSYVGAVACDEPVGLQTSDGPVRRLEVRDVPAWLASTCWQTLAMNEGTKGPRLFDFACVPLWHQGRDEGWHSLRIRRPRDPTAELTYYLVFAPPATRLEAKVSALGARWRIEEDFENGTDLGLDHDEVRSFVGWYRHITLVMLALAYLSSIAAAARQLACSLALEAESKPFAIAPPDLELLSVPEARHLLARLLFPLPASVPLVLQWSAWRRRHHRLARLFHIRRRRDSG